MSFPRYPAYKPSGVEWLGDVPAHWDVVQFKQYVDIQNGADHKHIEQAEGYPVLGSGGLFTYASDFLYDGESVLLGRKGTIDKPLHVTGRFWTVDTMYWTKIKPNASGRFAYYLAVTIPFDYYSTNTALPSMTKGALNGHFVAQPSLAEQTRIAEFLDGETGKIDGLVAEQRRLLALLKEKRQAVISHAVTRGLNPHAPLKPSGIEWLGDVPEHWEITRIKKLSSLISKGTTPTTVGAEFTLEGIRFLKAENVTEAGVSDQPEFFISEAAHEVLSRSSLKEGDVLVVIAGATTGKSAVLSKELLPANTNQAVSFIRPKDTRISDYISLWLGSRSVRNLIQLNSVQSAQPNLSMEDLGNIPLLFPPSDELNEIMAFVANETGRFDTLTAEAERAIELLQERRSALISAAVTGQIDVRAA